MNKKLPKSEQKKDRHFRATNKEYEIIKSKHKKAKTLLSLSRWIVSELIK